MFVYGVYDALTRQKYGTLDLTAVSFNDPLHGAGQLSGTLSVGRVQNVDNLRQLIDTGRAAIYAIAGRQILWPGLLMGASWNPGERTLAITATQASAWLSERLAGTTGRLTWTNQDQLFIARHAIQYATAEAGCPRIVTGTELSGVTRTVRVERQSYTPYDELIDDMAQADNGFVWAIRARFASSDGLPEWYLSLHYPERQAPGESALMLSRTPEGGNIIGMSEWPSDFSNRRSRVYALGAGEAPTQRVAVDTSPDVADNLRLLREKTISFGETRITAQLADHARAEREALEDSVGTVSVDVSADNPVVTDYFTGDRARLIVRDEWLSVDLPAVKIVDRAVRDEDRNTVSQVTLTLDISDKESPDTAA